VKSSVTGSLEDRGINCGNTAQFFCLERMLSAVTNVFRHCHLFTAMLLYCDFKPVIFAQKLDYELTAFKIAMEEDK
jgi:hypothetical protein